jgi:hypothetical protein
MKTKRFLLLAFVVLSCTLIALIWVVNMTEQGAEAARPIVITAVQVDEPIAVAPSIPPVPTAEPEILPSSIPTLSDILEDQ